tara:strand:- start:2266 stop:3066 length:801 start_codon:yes stop_codon:yes gene_type:complete
MVRVALYEKGLNFSEKHIKLCDQYPEGENLCKDFLRLNPLGTVPVIKINEKVTYDSVKIIRELDKLQGNKDIKLCNNDFQNSQSWVLNTTITEGVKFASTIGTILPVFSAPLIQSMVKSLPLKSILKILLKHPRRDRKIIFLSMYFFGIAKNMPKAGIKNFVKELISLENILSDENEFFYGDFSHVDINMMCLFHRLKDLQLEDALYTNRTPLIKNYWESLKNRESYKMGILDYYSDKEYKILGKFYKNQSSIFLKPIIEKLTASI